MAVTFERTNGGFRISRTFQSPSAATAGALALDSIVEAAFIPQPFPTAVSARELTPAAEALIERCDEEAPLAHLKAGEAFHGATSNAPLNLPSEDAE